MSTSNNPLLDPLRIPGETFQLPSQGIFYTNDEIDPSVKHGEIELYPMTGIDEIVFSSPDKLLSGKAVTEVFGRCIPQINKPTELLTKDVDFLMICLRMITFGQQLEVPHLHDCENAKEHKYSIDLSTMIRSVKKIDPTSIGSNFSIQLPNQQVAELKPMNYGSILKIYDAMLAQKTAELTDEEAEELNASILAGVIKSVDSITNPDHIKEWVHKLPLGWKKMIENKISNMDEWGMDFVVKQVCKDCGEEISLTISANPVNFFFQQST
jgi:hypothetical protein